MYAAGADPYCYKGTAVLKNKLKLRDPGQLAAFEAEISAQRADEPLPPGELDRNHYLAIHHHLFQDVYAWAGCIRTIRISKGPASFCYPENIEGELERIFSWLSAENLLQGLSSEKFAAKAAHFLAELNAIHPFREGNGRTQNVFLVLLADRAGHPLDMDRLDPQSLLSAMVASFGGNEAQLAKVIGKLLRVPETPTR